GKWSSFRVFESGRKLSTSAERFRGLATAYPDAKLGRRQWNGGAKDVIGIVVPLRFDETFRIGTIAFHHACWLTGSEQVGVSARKRHRIKGMTCSARPSLMLLFFDFVRRGENLDEHMVTAQAEGRRRGGHARGSAFELVRKNRASGGHGALCRPDENVDAVIVE